MVPAVVVPGIAGDVGLVVVVPPVVVVPGSIPIM